MSPKGVCVAFTRAHTRSGAGAWVLHALLTRCEGQMPCLRGALGCSSPKQRETEKEWSCLAAADGIHTARLGWHTPQRVFARLSERTGAPASSPQGSDGGELRHVLVCHHPRRVVVHGVLQPPLGQRAPQRRFCSHAIQLQQQLFDRRGRALVPTVAQRWVQSHRQRTRRVRSCGGEPRLSEMPNCRGSFAENTKIEPFPA